jgi:hypothetical protein
LFNIRFDPFLVRYNINSVRLVVRSSEICPSVYVEVFVSYVQTEDKLQQSCVARPSVRIRFTGPTNAAAAATDVFFVSECLRAADFRWPKSLGVREETYRYIRGQIGEEAEYSCCGDNQGRSIGVAGVLKGRRYFVVSGVVESDKIHRKRMRLNFFDTLSFQKVGPSTS